jgi:hypothetical protein
MGATEVEAFLTHLATERNVSASTQNQAKSANLLIYKQVLKMELPGLAEVVSAKRGSVCQWFSPRVREHPLGHG